MAPKNLPLISTYLLLFLLLLLLLTSPSTSQSPLNAAEEKQLLLQIKQDWGDPLSIASWNSSTSTPHCNWPGITCNEFGSVYNISLSNQDISNPIPPSICNLKNLSVLDLSYNNIPKSFPTSLYNCVKLTYLDLSQNLFVGKIPSDIDHMPSGLTDLYLTANNFSGDIPASIGRLKSLVYLYLNSNLFNGTFPAQISNLTNLQQLVLAENPFAPQQLPEGFGNLTQLTFLWMSSNNLVGEIPPSFNKLVNLTQLDLSQNSLVGVIPGSIWSFKNLQYIFLYNNYLTGEINATVEALELVKIDVSMNNLTGTIPSGFGKLMNLILLSLFFNQLTGEIPASIAMLPNLYEIRLFNNHLTGVLPPRLGEFSPLWNLEVDDNRLSGELPQNLCKNGAFSSLIVFDNNLTGSIPESLGSCAALDNLMLARNHFSGEFPAGIWSATNLSTVIIHDNQLSGTLPNKMPWNLTRLDIQNNGFSGPIPTIAGNLVVFLGTNNQFTGSIPVSFSAMSKLQSLSLGSNMISGPIPTDISSLKSLTDLNLSSNQLVGDIPPSLASLPVLTSLDLSSNELSGGVPAFFGSMQLNFLNLSSNKLSGVVPASLQSPVYYQSFRSNPSLCSYDSMLGIQNCGYSSSGSNDLSSGIQILIIVLGVVFFMISVTISFLVVRDYKKKKMKKKNSLNEENWKLTSFRSLDFNESSIVKGLVEENVVGSGGSGKVYRIEIGNRAGEIVAVKKIWDSRKMDSKLEKEFLSEVQILGSIRHTNIVKLLCCISSAESKLLVYEYMKNGSLDKWLHEKKRRVVGVHPMMTRNGLGPDAAALDWPRRLGIAIGAARGLSYMHHDCSPPVVHRDVKSSNILLDSEFRARIADFGLARMLMKGGGESQSVTAVAGSFGYMAPECAYTTKVNEKMDVYSFGVVLLELTTGREASDGGEQGGLADWAWHHFQAGNKAIDAIDEAINDPAAYLDDIAKVIKLGLICTGTLPSTRPTMKEVTEILHRCDQSAWNEVKLQVEHDWAPLLRSNVSNRDKNLTVSGENSDNSDSSGLTCNV